MPTKPLDRLMFAQGNLGFFCKAPLARADASVEHLLARANGGTNADDNCVACCKTMNRLLEDCPDTRGLATARDRKAQNVRTLTGTILALLKDAATREELPLILKELQASGQVIIDATKLSYALSSPAAQSHA